MSKVCLRELLADLKLSPETTIADYHFTAEAVYADHVTPLRLEIRFNESRDERIETLQIETQYLREQNARLLGSISAQQRTIARLKRAATPGSKTKTKKTKRRTVSRKQK